MHLLLIHMLTNISKKVLDKKSMFAKVGCMKDNVEAINPDLLPAEKTLPEVYNSGEPLDEIFF